MNEYLKFFLRRKAAPLLAEVFLPHNKAEKEICESMAMYEAGRVMADKLEETMVIVLGDGVKPRTGSLFAVLSKAEVHSIDPIMGETAHKCPEIERLTKHKAEAKDVEVDCKGKRALLVYPHSHCDMREGIECIKNYSKIDIINMPCCVQIPPNLMTKQNAPKIYIDNKVPSIKNKIYIWENFQKCTKKK